MIMNSMLRKVGYRDSNICRVSYKKKKNLHLVFQPLCLTCLAHKINVNELLQKKKTFEF